MEGDLKKNITSFLSPITRELFVNNKKQINKTNKTLLSFTAIISIILFSCMLVIIFAIPMDRHNPFKTNFTYVYLYVGMLLISALILIYCLTIADKQPALIIPSFYFIFAAIYIYAIINRFFAVPHGEVFTFEIVMVLMPIVLLDRTWRLCLVEALFLAVFIFFDFTFGKTMFDLAWRDDLVNMIICLTIGCFGGHTIRYSRIQALENERIVAVQRDTDELTMLPNRRKLFHELRKSFDGRSAPITCLFIADIDYFKKYNDTFGHPAGDEVLHKIGSYFKKFSEETGFELYRYGGEEFIGLYRASVDIDYADTIHQLCKEVRDLKIERALPNMPYITVSVGFAIAEKATPVGYDDFISKADNALYEAKRLGRNCTVEYAPSMTGDQTAKQ